MTPPQKQTLSNDLKVACEIYHFNQMKQPIWMGKLIEIFFEEISERDISRALDNCTDWMIIKGEYGKTERGQVGYCYEIDLESGGHIVPELYNRYWKK